ncbi:hypothetical protein QBC36DRAFT_309736 [Triangularia setosa]|uniref:Uncharacterized protein n=1 Tax=Triangularia setosa TaxID=2587417 RepID=A0AAN6WD24_9PEZI|nr:hypothetical protein QBC36DRAFT_309736 [Podospora setosa]
MSAVFAATSVLEMLSSLSFQIQGCPGGGGAGGANTRLTVCRGNAAGLSGGGKGGAWGRHLVLHLMLGLPLGWGLARCWDFGQPGIWYPSPMRIINAVSIDVAAGKRDKQQSQCRQKVSNLTASGRIVRINGKFRQRPELLPAFKRRLISLSVHCLCPRNIGDLAIGSDIAPIWVPYRATKPPPLVQSAFERIHPGQYGGNRD